MELSLSLFSSPFTILLTLVVIGALKLFAALYRQYFYWKKEDVPYLDSLPIAGMPWGLILQRTSFADYSCDVYSRYPDARYVGLSDLTMPTLIVRDPELIKEIIVKDFEHFTDHRTFVDESMDPLFSKNVFFLRGDRWKEMRNKLSPSFTASKMKILFSLVSKCARDFVDYLSDHPEFCSAVDLKETFRRYATDVIASAAFGINVNSMQDRNNEFYVRGMESDFSGFRTVIKLMLLRVSVLFSKVFGLTLISRSTYAFFKRIIAETIKFREEQGIIRPDMIHLLMQSRDKETSSAHEMTLDDIVAQAFIFFLAGFHSAATLMCFVVHELAVNPGIQDRLREEVENHIEHNGEISYESLSKMTYLDMVISEALRKYPPVIYLDRVCVKRYEMPPSQPGRKRAVVEPDFLLLIPVYSLHNDPKYFPNPHKFDPERFSDENKDNITPYSYLPFGHGPRRCIGDRFALMETKLLVAHLLRKFVLKRSEKTVEPIVFDKKQFTLQAAGGFWIGLEKREV